MREERTSNILEPWGNLPRDHAALQPCFECGFVSTGRHHVVPVCKGGTKVIPLCLPCHAKIHDGLHMGLASMIKEGIAKKRQSGWQPGRPRKFSPTDMAMISALHEQGMSYKAISAKLGMSVGTISAHMRKK